MANFYGELIIRITGEDSGLKRTLKEDAAATTAFGNTVAKNSKAAAQRMEHVGRQMQNIGRQMTQFVTLPIAAGFAVAGISAYKYEEQLIKIRNLTGLTAEETKKYGDAMLDLGKQTGQTPLKLSEAFYFLASSGFKGKEALDALKVSAEASAAGLGDVMATADVVSSAVNAYGHSNLTAAHMVDVLMKTIEVGKAEPEALAASLGRIMPVAQGLKVPIEDLGGMIAGLTLTGLSSAEAVTSLRGTMMALTAPTKMSIEAYKEMGLTYKEVTDSIAKDGLLPTLQRLYERVDGDRLAMRKLIPNVRALNGVLSLLGPNYQKNLEVIDKVNNAQGKLNQTMKDTRETNVFKLRAAWASLQASFIKIGATLLPVFVQIAQWVERLVDKFNGLSEGWKNFLLKAAATAAIIGPVVMVLGTLINALGLIRGAIAASTLVNALSAFGFGLKAAAAGAGTVGEAFGLATAAIGPFKLALLGVAAVAAAGYGLVKLTDWLDGTTRRIGEMRKAAEAVKNDNSIKEWSERNLGGYLEAVGKNDFKWKITPVIGEPDTSLLKNWTKTVAAQAAAEARQTRGQGILDVIIGRKADIEQTIHELETRMQMIGAGRRGGGITPYEQAMKDNIQAQITGLKAMAVGVDGILEQQKKKFADLKLHDQAIVFKAKISDVKSAITKVKAQLKDLKGKPHSISLMLKEERLRQRLSDLRAGLGDLSKKSFVVRLHLRIEDLQKKVELARQRLARLKAGGEHGGGKSKYSPEVSADISKLEKFVKRGDERIASMKERAEASKPTVDVNSDPFFTSMAAINAELDRLAARTTETSVVVKTEYSDTGPPKHSGGLMSGPHSGYPATLHGTELILPMDHPNLIPGLLRMAGLTAEGRRTSRVTPAARELERAGARLAPQSIRGSEPVTNEVHYHSHVTVPQGIVVDDTERFARQLAPWQERELDTAYRRRQRGLAGL